ncbi:basal body-orientation factor 1 isoform X1 [Bufo gargarizans]|uniref:basal body-orientation factor 1 isoform X1 n=1 Tax=Bufo gargarizans TaxID=30331 RepID=UPI001CF100A3|nr:basal body-orientation factor 1 isoform X1 [Bufo gargarizans]
MAGIRRKAARGKKTKRKKAAGKHELGVDKESEVERAKASAAVWETRLKVTEFSRAEYREAARSLAQNNAELTKNQYQLEKDMLDVIGFLKKQDERKDDMIVKLQQQLIAQRKMAEEERARLVETYQKQISGLEEECSRRAHEMQVIQSEFRAMKEFHRHKAELERELEEIKDSLLRAKKDHQKALSTTERHFMEEKQRLEKEAEKKIIMLAEEAHTEAVTQLGDVGRSVFKENVRLREAISYHVNQTREIQKRALLLQEEKKQLLHDKETNQQLIQQKIKQDAERNIQIQALQQTIRTLENALEKMMLQKEQQVVEQAENVELQKLQKTLEMKDREMKRVKKLAHNILQERTQVEGFFLEALEDVKQEIKSSRNYYQKMAQVAYHSRMRMAASGSEQYPKVRTFHNREHSTNDVSRDLMEAEKWSHLQRGGANFGDLTWEQKEKVLRLLFAKMNGSVVGLGDAAPRKRREGSDKEDSAPGDQGAPGDAAPHRHPIFLTQPVSEESATGLVLPDIQKTRCRVMS